MIDIIESTVMTGVEDVDGDEPVCLVRAKDGRLLVNAVNQGGYDCTMVDLRQLLRWVSENLPEELPTKKEPE